MVAPMPKDTSAPPAVRKLPGRVWDAIDALMMTHRESIAADLRPQRAYKKKLRRGAGVYYQLGMGLCRRQPVRRR